MDIEQLIEDVVHPIKVHVEAAVAEAKAEFETEKTAIAAEVRQAITTAVADAKDIAAAVEAVLAARGL